jgi:hypothetical protein
MKRKQLVKGFWIVMSVFIILAMIGWTMMLGM